MKKTILTIRAVGLVLLIFAGNGCKPEDPITPNSPLNGKTTAIFNPDKNYGTVADVDGNEYKTIVIGTQTWMAENMRVTHYRNGDEIPCVTDTLEWAALGTGAYCNYNNTESLDTIATYGRLYNWFVVGDSRNVAPKGWRVATADDWNTLFDYLGGDAVAGDKLKEVGNTHWKDPIQSDNSSGFTALPGGWRWYTDNTAEIGYYGIWWTANEYNGENANLLLLVSFISSVYKDFNPKKNGYSLRCIKE